MEADNELSAILQRRQNLNDAGDVGQPVEQKFVKVNVYTEFKEFSRKQIKEYETRFKQWVKFFLHFLNAVKFFLQNFNSFMVLPKSF